MATEFKLPDLGENIESGDVVGVLVSEGDEIQATQNVVELETDKATVEVPCPISGRVTKIHVKAGDTVPVGGLLLTVEAGAGGQAQVKAAEPAQAAEPPKKPAVPKPAAKPAPPKPAAPVEAEHEDDGEAAEAAAAAAPARPALPVPRQPSKSARGLASTSVSPLVSDPQAGLLPPHAPAGPCHASAGAELGVDLHRIQGTGTRRSHSA